MQDLDPHKESARQRATRKWRNNQVLKESQATGQEPQTTNQTPNLNTSRMRKMILEIISEHTNDRLQYYMSVIDIRRRRLLKEKLRRLKETEDE